MGVLRVLHPVLLPEHRAAVVAVKRRFPVKAAYFQTKGGLKIEGLNLCSDALKE